MTSLSLAPIGNPETLPPWNWSRIFSRSDFSFSVSSAWKDKEKRIRKSANFRLISFYSIFCWTRTNIILTIRKAYRHALYITLWTTYMACTWLLIPTSFNVKNIHLHVQIGYYISASQVLFQYMESLNNSKDLADERWSEFTS